MAPAAMQAFCASALRTTSSVLGPSACNSAYIPDQCASCDKSECVMSVQVLSKLATGMWNATAEEYTARAAQRMQHEGQRLLDLLDDLDELLATHW